MKLLFSIKSDLFFLLMIAFMQVLLATGCQRRSETMETAKSGPSKADSASATRWNGLSRKKIFFGHQSVGDDIIMGINDIMKSSPQIRLSIRRTKDPVDFDQPVFGEFPLGRNEDPKSKIDDFRAIMENGVGAKADVAFFKLCFIDVNAFTDIDALFAHYKATMSSLQTEFPNVRFIHCTMPLTTMDSGVKLAIKKLLGRDGGVAANAKRCAYNRLMAETCGKEGIVFDIARLESTLQDGSRSAQEENGSVTYGLSPSYTNDGGHLNPVGRVLAAKGLLELLTTIP
jgi:hypothetical protein